MIELIDGRKHKIIKRDGRTEDYDEVKLYKVLLWATEGKETYADILLEALEVKIFDKITISKLFDEVINTAANMITELAPFWDTVARNLYLQKVYKEVWGIKRSEYPEYSAVLKKGMQYQIYDHKIVESFSESDIQKLNDMIQPDRDFDMDYLGLRVFIDKYSLNHTQTKILELPQHGFMRLALFAFWKEDSNIRLDLIQQRYLDLSSFKYSEATPKFLNSLGYNPQMSSCVVSKIPDNSWGINKTISNLGLYSKHGGGLAADISSVRAQGSKIGKSGKSSGTVPFIKLIESIVTSYNQNGCVSRNTWVKRIKEIKKDGITYNIKDFVVKFGAQEIKEYLEPSSKSGGKGSSSKTDYAKYKHSLTMKGCKDTSPFSKDFYIKQGATEKESVILSKDAYMKASSKAIVNGGHQIQGGAIATRESFQKKYGFEVGNIKFDILDRTRVKITSEHLQNLYGFTPEEASQFKNNCSLDKFIERHGEKEGKEKYESFLIKTTNNFKGFSKEANLFIEQQLVPFLRKDYQMLSHQYSLNGGEFQIITPDSKLYKYDFISEDLKLIVEYHGAAFHPKKDNLTWTNPFGKSYEEQYKVDTHKREVAENMGYKYISIFSDEVESFKNTIKDLI